MDAGDSDWWWRYGLDGIAGGVIGGLVTAMAVIVTLRHERRMADLQEARTSAARLVGVAWRVQRAMRLGLESDPAYDDLPPLMWELQARTGARWPEYAALLEGLLDSYADRLGIPDATPSASDIAGRISSWSSDWIAAPERYSGSWRQALCRRVRRLTWRLRRDVAEV